MGVQGLTQATLEEVPTAPSTVPYIHAENSDDDLFSDHGQVAPRKLGFHRDILPILPAKGMFEDFLNQPLWEPKEKKKYCSGCLEDVKRDLNILAKVVDDYRTERDALKNENEELKKEIERLRNTLKGKVNLCNGDLKLSISNNKEDGLDLLVKKTTSKDVLVNNEGKSLKKNHIDKSKGYGIQSLSISLPKKNCSSFHPDSMYNAIQYTDKPIVKKTTAQLRKEFFEKGFQSEQKTFVSNNHLEIKPKIKEDKETLRSRLSIKIKPKKKINEIINKLTSKFSTTGTKNYIPEAPEIAMFQRFEKTRIVWQTDLETPIH